ncbi:MAG: hypothetical protein JNM28_12990 [Armatimonadetes bacterium]|nr:hypothetical protein [Armatimonadota bacterium]
MDPQHIRDEHAAYRLAIRSQSSPADLATWHSVGNWLVPQAKDLIDPSGQPLDTGVEWREYGKILDPLGYCDATLLTADMGFKAVACFNRMGRLSSVTTFDHGSRTAVVVGGDAEAIALASIDDRRANASFVGMKGGLLGQVTQEFGDGRMSVRKVQGRQEDFSAIRRDRHLIFFSGGLRLGSVEFANRVSPADCLLASRFALSVAAGDPKVV